MATPDEPRQEHEPVTRNGGSRPVPDPTFLTDAAIDKAVSALRDYVDGKNDVLAERMKGHWALDDERWSAFKLSDAQASRDAKDGVAAAIAAQKEAVAAQDKSNREAIDKSERATAETIKTNRELNAAKTDGLTKTVDELKIAVNTISATKVGGTENRTAMFAVIGMVVTVALAVLTVVGFVLANAP